MAGQFGRVAVYWVAYLAILLLAGFMKAMLPLGVNRDLFWGVVSSAALIPLSLIFLSRDKLASAGGSFLKLERKSLLRFAAGVLVGLATFALQAWTVSLVAGPVHLSRVQAPDIAAIAMVCLSFFALASMEELGFRGYSLWALIHRIGHWPAQAVVASTFALCHVLFGWPWSTVVMGVAPSGLLFGVSAAVSGGLAMPIGLHLAMNLGQWSLGLKGGHGLWTLTADPAAQRRLSEIGTPVGGAVVLCAVVVLWYAGRSQVEARRRLSDAAAAHHLAARNSS